MKYIVLNLSLFLCLFLQAQELSLNATNTIWYELADRTSMELPEQPNWQKISSDRTLISPEFPESTGVVLKNYEIAVEPLPRMLPVAIYPPAGGIVRFDERELSRYIEFVDEMAQLSDNTIEYQLTLEGRWTLDQKYRNEEWMIEFRSGYENWVEILQGNDVIAEGKSQVILQGSDIPKSGELQIRCSSWQKNNKGLIRVRVFKAYEKIIPDRFHQGAEAILKSGIEWQWATSNNLKPLKTPMDSAPILYKRIYICEKAEDTQNIIISHTENIKNVYINGTELNSDNNLIPNDLLKVGENEVIYYSDHLSNNLNYNLTFHQIKPFFLRTTVKANKRAIMKASLRGTRCQVFINGQFAGIASPEKNHEALGLGLFNDGDNEIILCLLQNSPKAFVESINIATVDETTPMVLPWKNANGDILTHFGNGPSQPYEGAFLSHRKDNKFTSSFSLSETPTTDLQLVFNSNIRLPTWLFQNKVSAPYKIQINGNNIFRNGHSFTIPAKFLNLSNELSFESAGLTIPEPLLYFRAEETKTSLSPNLTLIERSGQNILDPKKYFTGEELLLRLSFNPTLVDLVTVQINEQKTIYKPQELSREPLLKISLEKAKDYKIKVIFSKDGQEIDHLSKAYNTLPYPQNTRGWLRANGQYQTIEISDKAFFDSEAMLFPSNFASEWIKRELYSDSDELHFGPIRSWNAKNQFSIYDSLPNGQFVFDKFYSRLSTYLKIKSRGLPAKFILKRNTKLEQLWNSAAFTFQYLKYLEKNGIAVNWQKQSLDDYKELYVSGMPQQSTEFVEKRVSLINDLIKKMALLAAPGSTYEEDTNK